MRPTTAAALLVAILLAGGCSKVVDSPEEAVLRLELLSCFSGNEQRASAVAVGDDLAATVAHAFESVESFEIIDADGNRSAGSVVYLDPDRDLAMIRLVSPPLETLPLETGSDVTDAHVITFADAEGPDTKDATILRRTRVSLDGIGDRLALEIGAEIESGDSGGPVVDDEGRMIGMVFATSRTGDRGWAVDVSEVQAAMRSVDAQAASIDLVCEPAAT